MSESNTIAGTRVRVRNHTEAPQGVYEAGTMAGSVATYIMPNESKVVRVDDATLKHLRENHEEFSVTDEPEDDKAVAERPAPAGAAAAPIGQKVEEDQFDKMSDEELRAFVTDRGQKPQNFAGRAKLLIMARGPADAGAPDETV